MRIKTLYLQNFRLYDEVFFQFSPGFNVITGPNARGKTTILEAIYLLIAGGSFRSSQLSDMIRHGAEFFLVEARFEKEGMEQQLRFAYNGKEKRIVYNGNPCKNAASMYGLLKGIAMTPDDVALVKGGPAVRRDFIDLQLSQIDPLYVYFLSRYQRAMRQRNALLKLKQQASISSWEHEMAAAAAYIVPRREKEAKDLGLVATNALSRISDSKEKLGLVYKTDVPGGTAAAYKTVWEKGRERDFYVGHTTAGPHKDDLLVTIGDKEARYFASEGQQRSCTASLRFAGWDQLRVHSDTMPLMLIDDVGVSLDAQRRERLFASLEQLGQVFVTSAEPVLITGGHTLNL